MGHDLVIWLQIARDEDLMQQIGRDIYFDLVDHERVRSFRIQKQVPFNHFKVIFTSLHIHPIRELHV